LAGFIAKRIEADSLSIINILNNDEVMKKYDLNSENASLMFIPNTYEVYWNTSAEELLNRMHSEYKKFWNEERLQKASNMNMTPQQVGVLASIVQQETNYLDEMDRIAGVYINRINMGMPLQADPTIVFAHGDFTINRVLKTHLEINSPYNTYINKGLPPGPISLPSPQAIDRVLNYEKHDYLYFCAKEDFSGYHAFAKTLQQHLINARRYQQELNYQKILR
ncbi:MAG: endolytic transglycosylase MltG, partial [Bacteroidota bacterium]